MFSLLSSQLAFSAASTLAKKSFEFGIVQSLKGVTDAIKQRFSNNQALLDLQAELERKVHMLLLPVDILAHYATRGNTALQEPLGVALGVLDDVELFRQALAQHDVSRAQDGSSPDPAANAAQLTKRLKDLICRLDSVLPYLTLAISTVALLNQGSTNPISASRLMAASWHLRSNQQPGAAVFALPEASWHEERQLTAAGPSMSEVFRLCSLAVCRQPAPTGATGAAAAAAAAGGPAAAAGGSSSGGGSSAAGQCCWEYELLVREDLEDGIYHEAEDSARNIRLQVSNIVALEWETTQSLNQGENEYRPALVLHALLSSSGGGGLAAAAAAGATGVAEVAAAADGGTASRQLPSSTLPGSLTRPGSRASSRTPAAAAAAATSTAAAAAATSAAAKASGSRSRLGTPPAAGAAAAAEPEMLTPVAATPAWQAGAAAAAAAAAGGVGGVGGSIRRFAVMCNLRHSSSSGSGSGADGEQHPPGGSSSGGSEAGSSADGHGSSSDDDYGSTHSGDEGEQHAAAGVASPSPPPPAAAAAAPAGGFASSSGPLQREWQLLGQLEYVLRLCILESREQAAHQDITDERVHMVFQATSVPPAAAAAAAGFGAGHGTPHWHAQAAASAGGGRGSTRQLHRRSSTAAAAAAAAARWRSAAAGAASAVHAGVEAVTAGVRQLSFTPGAAAAAAVAGEAGSSPAVPGRTRSGRSKGTRGFGSPVQ